MLPMRASAVLKASAKSVRVNASLGAGSMPHRGPYLAASECPSESMYGKAFELGRVRLADRCKCHNGRC